MLLLVDLLRFVAIIKMEGELMENLLFLRKRKGVTQKDVADYLKISRQASANYETGKREPDIDTLKSLSLYFEVSIDVLLSHSPSFAETCDTPLDEREKTLVNFFRKASEQGKQKIIQNVLNICDSTKK